VFSVNHIEGASELELRGFGTEGRKFILPSVSDGMAQNAALALHAALRLGIRSAALQNRLRQWQPAALRGEVRRENGRLLFLDCYNANPASMADAIAAFVRIAPADEPRLYLIGCMEELGADAGRYHRELGAGLQMRPDDVLIVLGDWADEVGSGAARAGAKAAQILSAIPREKVSALLKTFRGAVFVKGSRRHELEKFFISC
jgi:UDP-N-acetylmuramoyl-tripeptide--D-alanyl-D-alanine ligase